MGLFFPSLNLESYTSLSCLYYHYIFVSKFNLSFSFVLDVQLDGRGEAIYPCFLGMNDLTSDLIYAFGRLLNSDELDADLSTFSFEGKIIGRLNSYSHLFFNLNKRSDNL